MPYHINVTAITDRGLVRRRNEDAILVGPWISQTELGVMTAVRIRVDTPTVTAVADGIGGHAGGNVASRQALTSVAGMAGQWRTPDDVLTGLGETNEQLGIIGETPQFHGLGTTIAGMCFAVGSVLAFNVGDSRIYRILDGEVEQLSTDDALLDEDGNPTHVITQALGDLDAPPEPHLVQLTTANARYLLCSDGISGVVPAEELRSACKCSRADEMATTLVTAALENGARDNFSLLIVDVEGADRPRD